MAQAVSHSHIHTRAWNIKWTPYRITESQYTITITFSLSFNFSLDPRPSLSPPFFRRFSSIHLLSILGFSGPGDTVTPISQSSPAPTPVYP